MKNGASGRKAARPFGFWLTVALLLHLGFGLAAYLFLRWEGSRIVKPRVVSVSLLSLEAPGGGAPARPEPAKVAEPAPAKPKAEPKPKPKPKAEPKPVAKPKPKAVPVKKKEPVAAKKEAEQPRSGLEQSLERIRRSVAEKEEPGTEAPRGGGIDDALARLQEKVAAGNGLGSGSGAPGTGSGGGGTGDPYKAEVASIIQSNWVFSSQLLRNSYGMEVYVRIQVLRDGTIAQIIFDRKAPSEYLNNSVRKALENSSPLPPLPPRFGPAGEWIGFVFTPEGIEL